MKLVKEIFKKSFVISLFLLFGQSVFSQEVDLNESFSDIIDERSVPVAATSEVSEMAEDSLEINETSETTEIAETEDVTVNYENPVAEDSVIENLEPEENVIAEQINDITNNLIEDSIEEPEKDPDEEVAVGGIGDVPEPKRPLPMDKEKADLAAEKDESKEDYENNLNTIRYGLPSEIGDLMDKIIENDDPRFSDEIYDLFQNTNNASIKEKVLKYFTKIEDPCLEDFAVNLLNDPYDEKKEVVSATFKYIQKVKTKEAIPPVITLLESENEDYFTEALATIGELGGKKEAKFIAEYLQRDDLSDAQRQTLMRTLGKMKALNCWSQIVDILEDEDENTFVRMYAAEAIGTMEKNESVPILVRNYSATDPNLRQYVIKGLAYFPDVVEAKATIIQAIRDEHWKVRQEAISICKEKEFKDSIQYLIYRAKNDSEKVIKNASYEAIAKLNVQEGNDFLVGQITDKKVGDTTKQKAVEVLLKEGHAGEKEILELAESIVNDDKRKTFRYAVGKELAKNAKPEYENICSLFLASKDTTTISLGLDMYKNCKYSGVEEQMRAIAMDKKANTSIKNRIKKMLDIEEEEETPSK